MGPRRVDRVESSHSRFRSPVGRRSAKGGKSLSKGKEDNAGKGKGNNMSADNVQDEEAWAAAVTAATVAWNQAAWDQRHRASPFVIDSNMQSPEDCYAAGVARGFALATGGVAGGGKGVGKISDMGGSRSSGQQWAAGGGAGGGGIGGSGDGSTGAGGEFLWEHFILISGLFFGPVLLNCIHQHLVLCTGACCAVLFLC